MNTWIIGSLDIKHKSGPKHSKIVKHLSTFLIFSVLFSLHLYLSFDLPWNISVTLRMNCDYLFIFLSFIFVDALNRKVAFVVNVLIGGKVVQIVKLKWNSRHDPHTDAAEPRWFFHCVFLWPVNKEWVPKMPK